MIHLLHMNSFTLNPKGEHTSNQNHEGASALSALGGVGWLVYANMPDRRELPGWTIETNSFSIFHEIFLHFGIDRTFQNVPCAFTIAAGPVLLQ